MSKPSVLARLTGWPNITNKYRAHWRVMLHTHQLILQLLEDNADGDTRRASLAEWYRAERPVLDALRGTTSLFRIDGPRQFLGRETFAMGSLIESPGVTAHLDPVETLHFEERVRNAIEKEIARWIAEQDLQDRPPVEACLDRDIEDPSAIRRMIDWTRRSRWMESQSYVR